MLVREIRDRPPGCDRIGAQNATSTPEWFTRLDLLASSVRGDLPSNVQGKWAIDSLNLRGVDHRE